LIEDVEYGIVRTCSISSAKEHGRERKSFSQAGKAKSLETLAKDSAPVGVVPRPVEVNVVAPKSCESIIRQIRMEVPGANTDTSKDANDDQDQADSESSAASSVMFDTGSDPASGEAIRTNTLGLCQLDDGYSNVASEEDALEKAEWQDHVKKSIADQLATMKKGRTSSFRIRPTGQITERKIFGVTRKMFEEFVESALFNYVAGFIVLLNVVFIGIEANITMANAIEDSQEDDNCFVGACTGESLAFWLGNFCFTVLYLIEVALRIAATPVLFFIGHDRNWNFLDIVVLTCSIIDTFIGVNAVRVLRMARGLRLLRILRLFRDLREMVCMFGGAMRSLSAAILLLLTIMFIFAIFMAGVIAQSLPRLPEDHRELMIKWYRNVIRIVVTLLQCITGGVDWHEVAEPLLEVHVGLYILFVVYVVTIILGALNILTGIFVERAQEMSALDRDLVIHAESKRDNAFLTEMKGIFEEADFDGSGTISWKEFKEYLQKKEVRTYLAAQQLEAFDAKQLFNILTEGLRERGLRIEDDEEEEIAIEDFVMGCQRLKGTAKSVDVVALLQESRSMSKKLRLFMANVETRLSSIHLGLNLPIDDLDFMGSRRPSFCVDSMPMRSARSSIRTKTVG
jgi:hypothetical protein